MFKLIINDKEVIFNQEKHIIQSAMYRYLSTMLLEGFEITKAYTHSFSIRHRVHGYIFNVEITEGE